MPAVVTQVELWLAQLSTTQLLVASCDTLSYDCGPASCHHHRELTARLIRDIMASPWRCPIRCLSAAVAPPARLRASRSHLPVRAHPGDLSHTLLTIQPSGRRLQPPRAGHSVRTAAPHAPLRRPCHCIAYCSQAVAGANYAILVDVGEKQQAGRAGSAVDVRISLAYSWYFPEAEAAVLEEKDSVRSQLSEVAGLNIDRRRLGRARH